MGENVKPEDLEYNDHGGFAWSFEEEGNRYQVTCCWREGDTHIADLKQVDADEKVVFHAGLLFAGGKWQGNWVPDEMSESIVTKVLKALTEISPDGRPVKPQDQ